MTCHCNNTGCVPVFSRQSLRAMREGRFGEKGTMYVVVVACTCEAGDRIASRGTRRKPFPRYHSFMDVLCPGSPSDPENVQRLREFCANDRETFANRGVFADFNNRSGVDEFMGS